MQLLPDFLHGFYGGVLFGVVVVAVVIFIIWFSIRNFENNKNKKAVLGFPEADNVDMEFLKLDRETFKKFLWLKSRLNNIRNGFLPYPKELNGNESFYEFPMFTIPIMTEENVRSLLIGYCMFPTTVTFQLKTDKLSYVVNRLNVTDLKVPVNSVPLIKQSSLTL